MLSEKKQNEIKVLAKLLRREIGDLEDMKFVVKELFKGKAEVSADNDGQLTVYTGHTFGKHVFGMHTGDVICMETKEFLDS